jgi:type I restriction enzyme, R subunit
MNKRDLSERDICTKYITPAVVNAGWDVQWQIREEVSFTKGRIIVRGKLERRCILISRPDRTEDVGAKTVIYMPIHVHGALFSAGDGHATQGHGEV